MTPKFIKLTNFPKQWDERKREYVLMLNEKHPFILQTRDIKYVFPHQMDASNRDGSCGCRKNITSIDTPDNKFYVEETIDDIFNMLTQQDADTKFNNI